MRKVRSLPAFAAIFTTAAAFAAEPAAPAPAAKNGMFGDGFLTGAWHVAKPSSDSYAGGSETAFRFQCEELLPIAEAVYRKFGSVSSSK